MNRIINAQLRRASLALFATLLAPNALVAQAAPTEHVTVTITLMVPVQVKDLNPHITTVRLYCAAHPVDVSLTVNFDAHHNFGDAGPLVDGAYSGTAKVVLSGTAPQTIPPGQQWSYSCRSAFLFKAMAAAGEQNAANPGVDADALLAPGSGPNLVQGTFTTQ